MLSTAFRLAEKREGCVPLGPKLVLTRFDSSETASIFRRTASSRPDICYRTKTINKYAKKRKMISYFVPILEELDVIRLWDFQSHSASGSAATLPKQKQITVPAPSGPVSPPTLTPTSYFPELLTPFSADLPPCLVFWVCKSPFNVRPVGWASKFTNAVRGLLQY